MNLDLSSSDLLRIGKVLNQRRKELNITLNEAEARTKIRKKYIKALESGNFEVVGFTVFYLGYLKSYIKYLDMDDKQVLELLDFANDNKIIKAVRSKNIITDDDFNPSSLVISCSLLLFLIVFVYFNFYN